MTLEQVKNVNQKLIEWIKINVDSEIEQEVAIEYIENLEEDVSYQLFENIDKKFEKYFHFLNGMFNERIYDSINTSRIIYYKDMYEYFEIYGDYDLKEAIEENGSYEFSDIVKYFLEKNVKQNIQNAIKYVQKELN